MRSSFALVILLLVGCGDNEPELQDLIGGMRG